MMRDHHRGGKKKRTNQTIGSTRGTKRSKAARPRDLLVPGGTKGDRDPESKGKGRELRKN